MSRAGDRLSGLLRKLLPGRKHSRKPRPIPNHNGLVIDLGDWNATGEVLTDIRRIDSVSALDHPLPGPAPVQSACEDEVTRTIDQLAARNALDAGTDDVLDDDIETRGPVWHAHAHQQAAERTRRTAQLYSVAVENFVNEQHKLARLTELQADAVRGEQQASRELLGEAALPPLSLPVARNLPEPAGPIPATDLNRLLAPADADTVVPAVLPMDPGDATVPDDGRAEKATTHLPTAVRVHGGRARGWQNPRAAYESPQRHLLVVGVAVLALALVASADLGMIKGTIDRLLGLEPQWSWLIAAGLTIAALNLPMIAGKLCRRGQATGHTAAPIQWTLLTAWVLIGASLLVMRWFAADLLPSDAGFEGQGAVNDETGTDRLVAIVLAAVYLGTGILAWAEGYLLTNDAAATRRAAARKAEQLTKKRAKSEALLTRLAQTVALHGHELATRQDAEKTAHDAVDGLIEHLKAHSRVRSAHHLADPAATGITRLRPYRSPDQAAGDA
ncbi:hypothetical protein [Kribbella sp. NPDC051620]|uniref:hypothetical protein n=1 Tax=Kribbella sp. NPDC051620 TaxID=3364120 RepID=UPI00379A9CD4